MRGRVINFKTVVGSSWPSRILRAPTRDLLSAFRHLTPREWRLLLMGTLLRILGRCGYALSCYETLASSIEAREGFSRLHPLSPNLRCIYGRIVALRLSTGEMHAVAALVVRASRFFGPSPFPAHPRLDAASCEFILAGYRAHGMLGGAMPPPPPPPREAGTDRGSPLSRTRVLRVIGGSERAAETPAPEVRSPAEVPRLAEVIPFRPAAARQRKT